MQTVSHLIDFFTPTHYDLSLDIDRTKRSFTGTVVIHGESKSDTLVFHSKDLRITTALFDGKQAEWAMGDNDELTITHQDLALGKHIITIGFEGTITDAMHGMYPCYYTHDGEDKEWIATQFESHHAREVFPCIDEPAAKASFSVALTTEPGVTVLGNMPVSKQSTEDGKLVTLFDKTPRMSTYLLAWVIGDMHRKTAYTSDGVEVNVWATLAQSPESLDFALEHSVKSIEFFNEYFGVPYPLPKSDAVALPDFSSGAMENWGLITYRETALLADPATTTVASKQYIATVISHELSHQWFGNLVTMKWWNNLWLNESFATLMEYIAVDAIHPEWNAWLDFATHESIMALRRDAIDGVQPVQVGVNHPDEISTLFDGAIVYAKGARLMRSCQQFIGHAAFQRGLSTYFKEFAYQNTEAEDLWRHLSDASGKDISHFMNTWISQSGYPVVSVTPHGLSQTQFFIGPHEPSHQLWPIPLNAESEEEVPELLETAELALPISLEERLNVGDTAHFISRYTKDHLEHLLKRVTANSIDEIGRLQLLHEQSLLARAGMLPSHELVTILQAYRDETTESVWSMMALALGELKKFVETNEAAEQSLRQMSESLARPRFETLGWYKVEGESEHHTKLRSLILGTMTYSEALDILATIDDLFAAQPVENLDPELRGLILSSVVKRNISDTLLPQLIDIYSTTPSADLRDDICSGLTSAKRPEDIALLLSHMSHKKTIKPQDLPRWFAYLIRNRYAREATWQWVRDNWKFIEELFAGDKSYDYFVTYAANGLNSRKQLAEYREFFAPIRDQPALTRVIDLGEKEIQGRIDLLERDGRLVCEALTAAA